MDVILQTQNTECGLACIAMISGHHGNHVSLYDLRRDHGISARGITLARMISIAESIQLSARAVRLELEDLSSLQVPCVLHWDLNHFVVLEKVSGSKATIVDPAKGREIVGLSELSQRFTGVALELGPSASFARNPPIEPVRLSQLTGPIRGIWRAIGTLLLLSLSLQVFVMVGPFYMQWIIDHVLVSNDTDLLATLGVAFLAVLFLQVSIGVVRGISLIYLSNKLGFQWSRNVFSHLVRLPVNYFEKRHLGDVVSRLGSVNAIQRTLTASFVEGIIDGIMSLFTLAIILIYSWKLAAITIAAVLIYLGMRWVMYWPLRNGTEQQLVAAAKQQSHLLESIRGISAIKLMGASTTRDAGYQALMNDVVNKDVSLAKMRLAFGSSNQFIFGAEKIGVIWIGAGLVLENEFSLGMLVAYLSYKDQFAQRVSALIDKLLELRMLRLHGERLADITTTSPELTAPRKSHLKLPDQLSVEVSGLMFRHSIDDPFLIKNGAFRIEAGESVAFVGPSGCGKTSLLKIVLGLLEPEQGIIRVGDIRIQDIGLGPFREIVGSVMQDDRLFSGSISDNIAFGSDDVDLDRIAEAASIAAIHQDIVAMPMGYQTLIGDMGISVSGGQKQRILLARALYRNPRILILDEATSNLDIRKERAVIDSVRDLGITTLFVSHRKETINSADRIFSLRKGHVSEQAKGQVSSNKDNDAFPSAQIA